MLYLQQKRFIYKNYVHSILNILFVSFFNAYDLIYTRPTSLREFDDLFYDTYCARLSNTYNTKRTTEMSKLETLWRGNAKISHNNIIIIREYYIRTDPRGRSSPYA